MLTRRASTVAALVAALLLATLSPARAAQIVEKDVNLDESLRLARALEGSGVQTVLTRDRDVFVPLGRRTALANELGADLFVSVHNNGSINRAVRGTEVYAQVGKQASIALASRIHGAFTAATGLPGRGVFQRSGDHGDFYFVLRTSKMASVIVEGAYLSNPDDVRLLASPAFRQRAAEGMARGIRDHLGAVPATDNPSAPPPRGGLIDPPRDARAAVDGHDVSVRFGTVPRATGYRLFRNGALVGEIRTATDRVPVREAGGQNTGPAELTITDLAPTGNHRYELRAVLSLEGSVIEESRSATVPVTVPWLVVIDPGHGGNDPGAVGRT